MSDSCVFCEIVAGQSPADVVFDSPHVLGISPLNPVTEGHVLFLPKAHVSDAIEDPDITALTMKCASQYGKDRASSNSMNLITSVGEEATQSVWHLHIHLVPRRYGDLLSLPWTPSSRVSTSYRSLKEDGLVWCASKSPGEVVKMSSGYEGQLTFERLVRTCTDSEWLPWDIS